ncbi:MAG: PadR family transcriptional regulator [Phycisphaerae bacterium]|nr:PadR family transcriptional regulator [Phycisphaerae bacterium]
MARKSLRQDQTELIVLAVLQHAPMYGYGISKAVAARSGGEVKLGPGMLYPLLASLESAKLVTTTWEEVRAEGRSDEASGRRRKWYRLTAKGVERLEKRAEEHRRQVALIEGFLGGGEPQGAPA